MFLSAHWFPDSSTGQLQQQRSLEEEGRQLAAAGEASATAQDIEQVVLSYLQEKDVAEGNVADLEAEDGNCYLFCFHWFPS